MRQKVEVKFLGDDRFQINAIGSGTTICVDKISSDHSPQGPNPLELFLSSLGACIGVFAKKYLDRHNIEFKELKIETEADFTTVSPMRLTNIEVRVSTDADLGQSREVFLRFIKNCPVHNTVLNTDRIDLKLR